MGFIINTSTDRYFFSNINSSIANIYKLYLKNLETANELNAKARLF